MNERRDPASGQADDLARRLDAERQALESSVKSYLDDRLGRLADPRDERRESFYRRWRAEVWGGLLLLLVAGLAWQVMRLSSRLDSLAAAPAAARDAAASPSPAAPPSPAELWRAYASQHPDRLARWCDAVASATGLTQGQVSDRQKTSFSAFRDALDARRPLGPTRLRDARSGLFEYVLLRWQAEQQLDPGNARVDLVIQAAEFPPAVIAGLSRHLGLDGLGNGERSALDADLQTSVVLAWLEQHQP